MKDFNLNKLNVLKELKLNNKASQGNPSGEMAKLQKNVLMQAGLAMLTIVLTIVILFAVTSAWYTNIIQTGGLVFNVQSWGFKGEVTLENDPVAIAPGDEGDIYLTAKNEDSDIIEINVNVEKTIFHEEMKKRLFFYADTQASRNGETMERVYINSEEDYTYTVFGNGTITLSEQVNNAPKLKWHWVYDMLGYYVLGTPVKEEDETVTGMTVKEYLRPIEYDYESAVFNLVGAETQAEGEDSVIRSFELVSIEGKTVAEFLEEITSADGYEGILKLESAKEGVYYPVSIDAETGEGVYLYLCTYTEIEMATKWDTDAGEIAYTLAIDPDADVDTSRISHEATINISAQKSEIVPTEAATAEDLKEKIEEAAASGTSAVIKLTDNVDLGNATLSIPEGANVMIDLGGKTITSSVTKTGNEKTAVIEAKPESSLTLMNGTVDVGEGSNIDYAVKTIGAEVVMNDVDITNSVYGVYVGDNLDNNTKDSVIYINKCDIDASTVAVFVSGNGTASERRTSVVIEDSTLKSDIYALCGNGTTSRWGTDIQVIRSKLNATDGVCVYHPQGESDLTLTSCTLNGAMGIAIKGGNVTSIKTDITATGAEFTDEFKYTGSGFNGTNDAIYIETNYNYDINLVVKGGTINSRYNYALRILPDESNVNIDVYNGVFISGTEEFVFNENWLAESSYFETVSEGKTVNVMAPAETETETETGTDIFN